MRRSSAPVAIVTDSTASLPPGVAQEYGLVVVPLQVILDGEAHAEGDPAVAPEVLAHAMRAGREVGTSRVSPQVLLDTYQDLAAKGHREIVSVHLSSDLSGTFDSATVAARQAQGVVVHPVDTREVAMGTGFAALAAAEARDAGASASDMARAALERAVDVTSYFYVDTLEHLRRGGRVSATAARVGSALAVKPILTVASGKIAPKERVRTAAKALARLRDLAIEAAADRDVDVAVGHFDSSERAGQLAADLTEELADRLAGPIRVGGISPVLGAHAGPGVVSVTVSVR